MGCIWVSVRFVKLTCHLTEGLAECSGCGNGDVVVALVTVIVGKAATLHAVDGGFAEFGVIHVGVCEKRRRTEFCGALTILTINALIYTIKYVYILVCQFCLDELAVQAGDVGDGFALGTYGLASAGVGAVTKAEFVHLGYHSLGTTGCLYATLGKESELADLRGDEEHSRAVLAGCHAGTTTDAGSAVHSLVSILLGNQDGVGILSLTRADGGVATSLDNLIEGVTVYHTVLDNREGS